MRFYEFWDGELLTTVKAADLRTAEIKALSEADALCDRPLENPEDRRRRIRRAILRGTVVIRELQP